VPELPLPHRTAPPRAAEPPYPCLLLLHGRGADEHDLLDLAELLDPRLLGISVRAPLPAPGLPGYQWHTSLGAGRPEPGSMLQSLETLRAVLAALPAACGADPGRLFVLGFSQGAAMALALGSAMPQEVAGTIALSGYWPPVARPEGLRGRPVFVGHGRDDAVVPLTLGRAVRDALAGAGAELEYHEEYAVGHGILPEELGDVAAWIRARLAATPPGAGARARRPC
jgi:phospholipase/carboxylesterase